MSQRNVDGGQTLKPAAEPIAPRAKGARIDPAVMAAALAEYKAGGSATEIAHRYGFSRNHFYERAQKAGIRKMIRVARDAPAFDGRVPEPPQKLIIGAFPTRLLHGEDVWAAIERDYCAGYPARAIEERYGVKVATLRDRAKRGGWRRKDKMPEPLKAPPDPAQVREDEDGKQVSNWDRVAHAAQRPPRAPWATWLFQGGRGAGKTRAGAEWLAARAQADPRGRFALIGATLHDVREVMIDGPSGLRHLPGRETPTYEVSRRRLVWSSGAEAFAFSAEEPERLRGPQFHAAWADEFCTWRKGDYTLMLARMGLRLGHAPQLVVTTTPKPTRFMRALRDEKTCRTTQASTAVNAAHLAPTFLQGLLALYEGTRFERQEIDGVLLDGEGALWRARDFAAVRGTAPERCERVIVAVDPAAGMEGAACGIVVAGRRAGRAYVLADLTAHGLSPVGWGSAVAAAARTYGAHEIVAETNHGGEMVRTTIALAAPPCPVRGVFASKSKRARAEPVAALYEQGRVVHAGSFPQLEEELMALGAGDDEARLDRADALVWAVSELLLGAGAPPRFAPL